MFTMEVYKAAYKGFVAPMEDSGHWSEVSIVLTNTYNLFKLFITCLLCFNSHPQHRVIPPPLYKPLGRSRLNRIKNKYEVALEKKS